MSLQKRHPIFSRKLSERISAKGLARQPNFFLIQYGERIGVEEHDFCF
jgi:hypothetical protein